MEIGGSMEKRSLLGTWFVFALLCFVLAAGALFWNTQGRQAYADGQWQVIGGQAGTAGEDIARVTGTGFSLKSDFTVSLSEGVTLQMECPDVTGSLSVLFYRDADASIQIGFDSLTHMTNVMRNDVLFDKNVWDTIAFAGEKRLNIFTRGTEVILSVNGEFAIPFENTDALDDVYIEIVADFAEESEFVLRAMNVSEKRDFPSSDHYFAIGGSTVTKNEDGTASFALNDKRLADIPSDVYEKVGRERIISNFQFDVNKPFIFYASMDWGSGNANWWGVEFSDHMTSELDLREQSQFGTAVAFLQFKSGLFFGYPASQNNAPPTHTTEYENTSQLDKYEITIGETNTQVTFNNYTTIWTDAVKKSDFSDGKAYLNFQVCMFSGEKEQPVFTIGENLAQLTFFDEDKIHTEYIRKGTPIELWTPQGKHGYDFKGWFTDPVGGTQYVGGEPLMQDTYLHARYELSCYTLEYELNGGSFSGEYPQTYTIFSEEILLPTPVLDGYDFIGWYTTADFSGDIVLKIEKGSTGNRKFYAKFTNGIFEIVFDAMGGEKLENEEYDSASGVQTLPVPVYTGYDFGGWFDSRSFDGEAILSLPAGIGENIYLYAKWDPHVYEIEYICNGGSIEGEYLSEYTILSQTFYLPQPTKQESTFCGWYLQEDFAGSAVEYIEMGSHDITKLYAKWEVKPYQIVYYLDGGKNDPQNEASYLPGEERVITLLDPQKVGYEFGGWSDNSVFDGERITKIDTSESQDFHLYAKWISDYGREESVPEEENDGTPWIIAGVSAAAAVIAAAVVVVLIRRRGKKRS